MHQFRLIPRDDVRRVPIAPKELLQLGVADACEHCRVGDLVAVEVEDRQHRPIARRVEELVSVPAGSQRPSLSLAVTHDASDDEIGVVEGGAERVAQTVPQLAAFVDRAGRLGRDVARDAAGEGELLEQSSHPIFVLRDFRVQLAVSALEISIGH